MPYRAPRRYAKRGTVTRKKTGTVSKLARDVKRIKKSLDGELKVQDTGLTVAMAAAPTWSLLNGLIRGDDYNNRQGRTVKWSSIYVRYTITCNPASVNFRYARVIFLWAKDPDGITPTSVQYFGTGAPTINQMPNLNLRKDFVVLQDKIVDVAGYSLPTDDSSYHFSFRRKTTMQTVFNASNTGLITDIESGALYFMVYSDAPVVGEQPSLNFQSRLRYVDN